MLSLASFLLSPRIQNRTSGIGNVMEKGNIGHPSHISVYSCILGMINLRIELHKFCRLQMGSLVCIYQDIHSIPKMMGVWSTAALLLAAC